MALHRQGGSGTLPMGVNGDQKISGSQRSGTAYRLHDHTVAVQTDPEHSDSTWQASTSKANGMDGLSRLPFRPGRGKKVARGLRNRQCSARFLVAIILSAVVLTIIGSDYIFSISRVFLSSGEPHESIKTDDFFDHPDRFGYHVRTKSKHEASSQPGEKNILTDAVAIGDENAFKGLHFGQTLLGNRDSRDWDSDDRNREITTTDTGDALVQQLKIRDKTETTKLENQVDKKVNVLTNLGLYNERGRKELRMYEKKFEADLENELESNSTNYIGEEGDDTYVEDVDEVEDLEKNLDQEAGDLENVDRKTSTFLVDVDADNFKADTNQNGNREENGRHNWSLAQRSTKTRRRTKALPCNINFVNSTKGLKEPEWTSKFANFGLKFVEREESPAEVVDWVPRFSGHQSWEEREQSFHAGNQTIHCGFVRGPPASAGTGFELSGADKEYLNACRIAVSSCIFGKSDQVHTPRRKQVSNSLKREVCFVMFVDQSSLDVMNHEKQGPDENGFAGIWRIVLVKTLPYNDFRRAGKVPKFLAHRLFPSARYSIWLDSKLRLQSDPISILEYFLWRGGYEYAISNHYDRHCVWDEVQQNKRLNKYNHSLIDHQFLYYQRDGLVKFNQSDPHRLLPSYVPEGSFIVRAHTPMSNLFSCLWFNEVDRFTPRDQLSFAYTYLKLVRINGVQSFRLHMFKDCERKTITKLFRHRQEALAKK